MVRVCVLGPCTGRANPRGRRAPAARGADKKMHSDCGVGWGGPEVVNCGAGAGARRIILCGVGWGGLLRGHPQKPAKARTYMYRYIHQITFYVSLISLLLPNAITYVA